MPVRAQLELYKDSKGDWRWRVRAKNGRILADSGEGYRRRVDLQKALERIAEVLSVQTEGLCRPRKAQR